MAAGRKAKPALRIKARASILATIRASNAVHSSLEGNFIFAWKV
jgi:hypothetical protein